MTAMAVVAVVVALTASVAAAFAPPHRPVLAFPAPSIFSKGPFCHPRLQRLHFFESVAEVRTAEDFRETADFFVDAFWGRPGAVKASRPPVASSSHIRRRILSRC